MNPLKPQVSLTRSQNDSRKGESRILEIPERQHRVVGRGQQLREVVEALIYMYVCMSVCLSVCVCTYVYTYMHVYAHNDNNANANSSYW